MRFSFPGDSSSLIFDNVDAEHGDSSLTIDAANGVIKGWSDVASGLSNGATRMFIYATFDKPITASGMQTDEDHPSRGYARFDAGTLNMRIATSLIGTDQARRNLELELAPDDTVESVKRRAQRQWDAKLGRVEVEGATDDQRTTLYSNLYRLFLYPNSAHENTGSARRPRWQHAVQSSTEKPPDNMGAPVVDGKVYVNNGFWDTYRTTWSAYSLFTPKMAGELVDGFVQQYRDGGWIARWSSPGYANLMTGTSSDAAFADAFVKGVPGLDARDTYDAAVKNATVAPPGDPWNPSVGRKGQIVAPFLGYTPSRVSEGVSWALEGDINDFGIANMAQKLAAETHSRRQRQRLQEEREYFLSRSQNYVNMFDPAIRFFQGRDASGRWKSSPQDYDPRVWGHEHDYTETDGWNFAFHTPHDGQGLANLYGGRDGLANKLDTFFSTPETAKFVGSYGGTIHEMIEARDVRMGQWGFSNQVSHHIPYMYDYTGQPAKAQAKVREVLRRLYLGSEIGQGYAGDEDNGETSAWYLFSALGIYPLQVGSENYVIGSPLFKRATVRLENGRKLVVKARNNSAPQRLRPEPEAQRAGLRPRLPAPSRHRARRDARVPDGPVALELGDRQARGAAVGDEGRRAGAAAARHDRRRRRERDDERRGRRGAVRQRLEHRRRADGGAAVAAVLLHGQPARQLLHADLGHRRRRRPERLGGEGLQRRQPLEGARRAQRRDVPLALADTAVQALAPGQLRLLPDRGHQGRRHARRGRAAAPGQGRHLTARHRRRAGGGVGGRDGAGEGDGVELRRRRRRAGRWRRPRRTGRSSPRAPRSGRWPTASRRRSSSRSPCRRARRRARYPVRVTVSSDQGTAKAAGSITVIGDRVEFTPATDAEAPWLFDSDGSQFDGEGRFTDGGTHATYRFQLPADVQGGALTLELANQFLVETSTDNQTWTTRLREDAPVRDRGNRGKRTLDLNALRDGGRTVYVRLGDSQPDDGWGGWLARVELDLQRG